MIDVYKSIHLQDSIEILEQLLAAEKWEFLRRTLKKYLICYDFLVDECDDLYLKYWRLVESVLDVGMENEIAAVHETWLSRHSVDFNIRTNARLGAFLRSAGCYGDFTLELTLDELKILDSWKEDSWSEHLRGQLVKIYKSRGEYRMAAQFATAQKLTVSATYPYASFGHELLDAELLEVTVPVFMDCVKGLPSNSLRYRYNLAKYFRELQAGSCYEPVH
jgi:hypothetical protein